MTVEETSVDASVDEDEDRLSKLGYKQELKRIFNAFTSFGLTSSMMSVFLGIIPLFKYSLTTGGPLEMIWSWILVGMMTLVLVSSLAEICSAFPTMGALYYWAHRLGGREWGPLACWVCGWLNLLGQIAGVASGAYAGAILIANIVFLSTGVTMTGAEVLAVHLLVLAVAGLVNTFIETILKVLCYISFVWHLIGVILIVALTMAKAPQLQSAEFVFLKFNNQAGFPTGYTVLIGALAAVSTFTGYDTGAHVAEETRKSHKSTPWAMWCSVVNTLLLGLLLIIGMNICIQDLYKLTDPTNSLEAYTLLWQQTVGAKVTIVFQCIAFVGIEFSNSANLTSASRMLFAFARDGGIPFLSLWYHVNRHVGGPVRSIWLVVLIAFLLAVPSLGSATVLSALFSLTATGLYSSYMIPIFLRLTVGRKTFEQREWSLGGWSLAFAFISTLWCVLMVIVLCFPQVQPISDPNNINYSSIVLGGVLAFSMLYWLLSARFWFRGAKSNLNLDVLV